MRYKLKDLCLTITDGSHFSPKAIPSGGYPMFSVKDMLEYDFDRACCKRISVDDFALMKKNGCVPQKGDVLVAKDGSYLKEIFVCREDKNEAILSSIAIFRPNPDVIDPYFLMYLLKSPSVFNFIRNNCVSGSALPRIVLKTFKEIELDVPPLQSQLRIVNLLQTIDSKIQINQRINGCLEAMGSSICSSLIDDSETSVEIRLGDLCSVFTGKKNANENDIAGLYKFFTCSPEPLLINSYICDGPAIIVSGNGAYTGRTRFYSGKFDLYQRTYACVIKKREFADYIYPFFWFVKDNLASKIGGGTRGSAIPYIVMGDLTNFAVRLNQEKLFSAIPYLKSSLETMMEMETENEALVEERDSLLPKLMSGEIDTDSI